MAATYFIDKQRKLVLSAARDILTCADLVERTDRLRRDPEFVPEYRELFDFMGVTRIELSAAEIQSMAAGSPFAPSSRRAFLVTGELAYALGRMSASYHDLNGERNISVFRDRAEALRWIETGEQRED